MSREKRGKSPVLAFSLLQCEDGLCNLLLYKRHIIVKIIRRNKMNITQKRTVPVY